SQVLVKPGSPYSQEQIDKSVEKMTLALSEQGHASMQVHPIPLRDAASRSVSVEFRIEEGAKIIIERIEIVGNANTKDFVIRRQLKIAEGDIANAFLLERARLRVQALGFFKSVTLKRKAGSAADKVIVVIEVVEDDTRNLAFGAGYSLVEGVVGD